MLVIGLQSQNCFVLKWLTFVSVLPAAENHLTLVWLSWFENRELSMQRCLDFINRMVLRVLTYNRWSSDRQTASQAR